MTSDKLIAGPVLPLSPVWDMPSCQQGNIVKVYEISAVTLSVKNMEKSCKFYSGIPGISIETADAVLMTEDLTKIPYLLKTSRQSLFVVKQNFFGTLFVDGLGFILAFVGLINPLLAAIIHVSSELVFMVNSSRLVINSNRSLVKT